MHRGRGLPTLLIRIGGTEARHGQKPPRETGTRLGVEPRRFGDTPSALLTLPAPSALEGGPVQEPEGDSPGAGRVRAGEGAAGAGGLGATG